MITQLPQRGIRPPVRARCAAHHPPPHLRGPRHRRHRRPFRRRCRHERDKPGERDPAWFPTRSVGQCRPLVPINTPSSAVPRGALERALRHLHALSARPMPAHPPAIHRHFPPLDPGPANFAPGPATADPLPRRHAATSLHSFSVSAFVVAVPPRSPVQYVLSRYISSNDRSIFSPATLSPRWCSIITAD